MAAPPKHFILISQPHNKQRILITRINLNNNYNVGSLEIVKNQK